MEHHLPVLLLLVPQSLQRRYPHLKNHLLKNQQRFVTSFDIYATLMSILHLDDENQNSSPPHVRFSRNLFEEEIFVNRTCEDANIPPMRCICK